MKTKKESYMIAIVNGQAISVCNDEQQLVPIRPVCDAIGVAYESQVNKIKEHPILGSTISLRDIVAADGKTREMLCLPLRYVYGWIFTINPTNVSEAARASVIRYQLECYDVLYSHFFRAMRRNTEQNDAEKRCLDNIEKLEQTVAEAKNLLREEKRRLQEIRSERLDDTLSLPFED
jgi:hypothetical protein